MVHALFTWQRQRHVAASELKLESRAALGGPWVCLPAVWFGINSLIFRGWTILYIKIRAKVSTGQPF